MFTNVRAQCFSWTDPVAVNEIIPVFQDRCEPVNSKETQMVWNKNLQVMWF
jgi:hypothetical protein